MLNWINKADAGCLIAGDIIQVPSKIAGSIIKHYGIILNICKIPYICHLPGIGNPILETLELFEKRFEILGVLRNEQTKSLTDSELFYNYNHISAKRYNFFIHNCEDFIRRITNGKVDFGFDQRCGFGCVILLLLLLIIILRLLRK